MPIFYYLVRKQLRKVRKTSSMTMGLARWAFMPAAKAASTSSTKALAVMAMMGIRAQPHALKAFIIAVGKAFIVLPHRNHCKAFAYGSRVRKLL